MNLPDHFPLLESDSGLSGLDEEQTRRLRFIVGLAVGDDATQDQFDAQYWPFIRKTARKRLPFSLQQDEEALRFNVNLNLMRTCEGLVDEYIELKTAQKPAPKRGRKIQARLIDYVEGSLSFKNLVVGCILLQFRSEAATKLPDMLPYLSDADLACLCLAAPDNEPAYVLVQRYESTVERVIGQFALSAVDREMARDATVESFLRHSPRLKNASAIRCFFETVARNKAVDKMRLQKNAAMTVVSLNEPQPFRGESRETRLESIADYSRPLADRVVDDKNTETLTRKIFAILASSQRETQVFQSIVDGDSIPETASRWGIKESNVMVVRNRIRTKLKGQI